MILGFLHLGQPTHGVRRFGQILAGEAKRRSDLTVIEVELTLSGQPQADLRSLAEAARTLSAAEVVQIQFTEAIWGAEFQRFRNVWQFVRHCQAAIAITIHDTDPPSSSPPPTIWQQAKHTLKHWLYQSGQLEHWEPSNAWIRQWLLGHSHLSLVCTQEERHRLLGLLPMAPVTVIPHFIEPRPHLPDRELARQALGFQGRQVVTLLGFIFGGKGHHLLLEALQLLPQPNLVIVFAGGVAPGSECILEDLKARAEQAGVGDRLKITGYLTEAELEQYLVATDVPVCPFEVCFASSSLASWISAGRLVVTSDLPQFQEYHQLAPGSVTLFSPYTAAALAVAIAEQLAHPPTGIPPAVAQLRDRLSLARTVEQHLEHYRRACQGR